MTSRRKFIRQSISGCLVTATAGFPWTAWVDDPTLSSLTILHTNDMHSRIDSFPLDGSRNAGMGGIAKRAALISKIRQEVDQVLLVDSGDIFQGTPYFNFFGGEIEIKSMSHMGYDAATLGNHDFDGGMIALKKQITQANFDFISSNYDFNNTPIQEAVKDIKIVQKGDVKIGLFGLGIELRGLVPPNLYGDTQYKDPIIIAQKKASLLRHELKCDIVICLSHLGYKYSHNKVSDMVVAQQTNDIDLILGGHTHTFLKKPTVYANRSGEEVLVSQAGWAGILLGRIDIIFEKNRKNRCVYCENISIK